LVDAECTVLPISFDVEAEKLLNWAAIRHLVLRVEPFFEVLNVSVEAEKRRI